MDTFDANLLSELKKMYCNKELPHDDYSVLFNRFSNLSNVAEAKPYIFAMRYLGLGTEADPNGVLEELKGMQLKDDIQLKGLACDLLLFQKKDNRILAELKRMKEQGYSDIYLGMKSHLHNLVSLCLPERGELRYHNRLSCGVRHICAIDADNHLLSFGWNQYKQCDVGEWATPDIISCDGISTFGIYSYGGVKVAGSLNMPEHGKIKDWTGIVDCKGTLNDIFCLDESGKIRISSKNELYVYLRDVLEWSDIVQIITTGSGIVVGLKRDGKLEAVKMRDPWGCTNIQEWKDIVQISGCTVGLKKDGTVLYAGNGLAGADEVDNWENIIQIAATSDVTYGLLENGDVICTPYNSEKDSKKVGHDLGQREVNEWHDIVSIWAGKDYVVGLCKNGKVKFAGDGSDGLGDVEGLQLY